jgi:hypothetical protein
MLCPHCIALTLPALLALLLATWRGGGPAPQ